MAGFNRVAMTRETFRFLLADDSSYTQALSFSTAARS